MAPRHVLRASVGALLASAALGASTPALAWDDTPKLLAERLGAKSAPACTLCHEAAKAPVGAADTPFAKAMIARGLDADTPAALDAAIAKMRADKVDSDGDGAEDLDEVSWGADPNHGDVQQSAGDPPAYGCGMAGGPRRPAWALVAIAGLALAIRRRRS